MDQEQRTDEWSKARLGKATASRFADIMAKTRTGYGASRGNYLSQLVVERLTGTPTPGFTTDAMQWGIDEEETAKTLYMLETGSDVEDAFFVNHKTLQAGASPDGYVSDDGLIEIKNPNTKTHIETLRSGKVPSTYKWQIQGQLCITERDWCDFVSADTRLPANARIFIRRVHRDNEAIAELEKEVRIFLEEVDQTVEFIKNYKGGI